MRSCVRLTKTRLPPTWLVLVPALALAAVGARAVMAEMRASQDAARERARSVASRLARSVDALVDEYAAPLPAAGDRLSVEDYSKSSSHLDPRTFFVLTQERELADLLAHSGEGALPAKPLPMRRRSLVSDKRFANEEALVRDALASARRIADAPGGAAGAAALLTATAQAVEEPYFLWPLRRAEAEYDASIGDNGAALDAIAKAVRLNRDVPADFDGTHFPEACLVVAAKCAGSADPPGWFYEAYDFCVMTPSVSDDSALDQIDAILPTSRLVSHARQDRRMARTAKSLIGPDPLTPISATVMTIEGGHPRLSLWRSYRTDTDLGVVCLLGGEIPQSVVEDRIGKEVAALAKEPGALSIRVVGPGGQTAFDSGGPGLSAPDDQIVVETSRIVNVDGGWRAQAVVGAENAVPATAWLLAAAVVATTAALLAGTIALRRAAERSARLAEERRTFLDHVAHELRTPAAAVQALSEELASGHVAADREPEYRRHLLRESRRLAGLVDDTLDFARLDAGRLAFRMEPADLRDVVRRAVEESDGAGRVVAKLPDAPVVRPVDEAALRRAVKNLVENAVRHGGGDAPVDVALEASNGMASIVVADHGRGIAAEHLPRIFERFWRAPSATHETKGVGLGLALCREVARAHGGDVDVVSAPGKGSTFTLRVPLASLGGPRRSAS